MNSSLFLYLCKFINAFNFSEKEVCNNIEYRQFVENFISTVKVYDDVLIFLFEKRYILISLTESNFRLMGQYKTIIKKLNHEKLDGIKAFYKNIKEKKSTYFQFYDNLTCNLDKLEMRIKHFHKKISALFEYFYDDIITYVLNYKSVNFYSLEQIQRQLNAKSCLNKYDNISNVSFKIISIALYLEVAKKHILLLTTLSMIISNKNYNISKYLSGDFLNSILKEELNYNVFLKIKNFPGLNDEMIKNGISMVNNDYIQSLITDLQTRKQNTSFNFNKKFSNEKIKSLNDGLNDISKQIKNLFLNLELLNLFYLTCDWEVIAKNHLLDEDNDVMNEEKTQLMLEFNDSY